MFNKGLEEIKKSQSIMNNAITGIKSTLRVTNSGITEPEERITRPERVGWELRCQMSFILRLRGSWVTGLYISSTEINITLGTPAGKITDTMMMPLNHHT